MSWMYWTEERFSGLDVLNRGWDQRPGCIGQRIGSVSWMHWIDVTISSFLTNPLLSLNVW